MPWITARKSLDLSIPLQLGILNLTPDSFSDGGRFQAPAAALDQARRLVAQGAGMLDLGAESTRPGAQAIGEDQEWDRLSPVLEGLARELPRTALSLDTRHPQTARRGLDQGACVLNDVTGFSDPGMLELARTTDCGLIAMRSRMNGQSLSMPEYGGVGRETIDEAIQELAAVRDRLLGAGITPERILLDPGFGFGTTFTEDLALWRALPSLPSLLDWPRERFCIAVSRKRFLAWRAGSPDLPAPQRDDLTREAHREALDLGYRVFRAHAPLPWA